ncbi:MAG: hypothetical protein J1E43_05690, partial [Christensenellaceae bacterium]|nr:hypothetical protein [Christensenellaceae bacterium]
MPRPKKACRASLRRYTGYSFVASIIADRPPPVKKSRRRFFLPPFWQESIEIRAVLCDNKHTHNGVSHDSYSKEAAFMKMTFRWYGKDADKITLK